MGNRRFRTGVRRLDGGGNPYNVVGDVNVPSGAEMLIEPGVHVIFQGYYGFAVDTNATLQWG